MAGPVVFLDVDGPLVPFGLAQYPTYSTTPASPHPLLRRINPEHGRWLSALAGELVWATTWEHDANECIAPLLGLPELPVVPWPEEEEDEREGLHWKTRPIVDWAAGRPFAWLDDEITNADRAWVAAHHKGPALLHRVDPRHGLTDADYAIVREWLREPG